MVGLQWRVDGARTGATATLLGTGQVLVIGPSGSIDQKWPTGIYDVSNLVFGGPKLNQLYVTGSVGHRRDTEGRLLRFDLDRVQGRP